MGVFFLDRSHKFGDRQETDSNPLFRGGSSPVGNMGLVVDESGDDPPKGEERLVDLPRLLLAVSNSA